MPSRRSVLATTGSAIAASLAGCSSILPGGNDSESAKPARRWLTGEVARIPYDDAPPVGEPAEDPLFRGLETGRPERAQSGDAVSDDVIERLSSAGSIGKISLPMEFVTEVTTMFGGDFQVALGEFEVPEPPSEASEAGSHRDATLYTVEPQQGTPGGSGYAVGDGICAFVTGPRTAEAVTAALEAILDAEAGAGTRIDTDAVDRVWSYLQSGFYEGYYAGGDQRVGISMQADGNSVARRSIVLSAGESEAEEYRTWVDEKVEESPIDGDERPYFDFGPYESVTVNRDGKAVTVEGSLPATDVGPPEFEAP